MGPYALLQFELNCGANQVRTILVANYDASGKLVGNFQGTRWDSIGPDTLGEILFNGACRTN